MHHITIVDLKTRFPHLLQFSCINACIVCGRCFIDEYSAQYSFCRFTSMEISFKGKTALVTGAGKGIGRIIAIELAKCGADVIALTRTQADLDSLTKEFPNIRPCCHDLSDWDETKKVISQLGLIHLLVNNAAVATCEAVVDAKPSDFDSMMNVNVKAALNVSQVVAENLIKAGAPGAIVNISSQASMAALKDHAIYSATKGALDSMTRVMALEFGPKNIRVNAVNPTVVTTDMAMVGWSKPERADWMKERIPLGRFGDPVEVAYPVLFLLSEKASLINGVCLPIDGGFTAC